MIILPSYVVGDWADGPDIISIPYRDLETFIDSIIFNTLEINRI